MARPTSAAAVAFLPKDRHEGKNATNVPTKVTLPLCTRDAFATLLDGPSTPQDLDPFVEVLALQLRQEGQARRLVHALRDQPRRFEGRLTHLTKEEFEAFEGALTVGLQVWLLVRAVEVWRISQLGDAALQLEVDRQGQGRPCESEGVQARAHDELTFGFEWRWERVSGGRGRGQHERDPRLEQGKQMQEVVELREVLGYELLRTWLSSRRSCIQILLGVSGYRKSLARKPTLGRTATDLFAAFSRQPCAVVRIRTHRRKEESDRIAHVDVVDRVEQRILDRPRYFTAQEQVVRRGEMRGTAGIGSEQRFTHLLKSREVVRSGASLADQRGEGTSSAYDQGTPTQTHIDHLHLCVRSILTVEDRLQVRNESASVRLASDGVVALARRDIRVSSDDAELLDRFESKNSRPSSISSK